MNLRLVIDTNIFISAIVFGGTPRFLIDEIPHLGISTVVSAAILNELTRKLTGKFKSSQHDARIEVKRIMQTSIFVTPTITIDACRDPDDNRILECAISGNADFIITGDRDLLTLSPFRGIQILTVRQFLDLQTT